MSTSSTGEAATTTASSTEVLGKPLGSESEYQDRAIGTLLAACAADILGANAEFYERKEILEKYEGGLVKDFGNSKERPLGVYTDDTEMLFALSTSLVRHKKCVAKSIAYTFGKYYIQPPRRGYGPSVSNLLIRLSRGEDYKKMGTLLYPTGSYANGAVMRIAPIGLVFREAGDEVLKQAVYATSMCTHVHPEALDGALIQAKAVAILCQVPNEKVAEFDCVQFVKDLKELCATKELKSHLDVVLDGFDKKLSDDDLLAKIVEQNQFGDRFQIKAIDAVANALWMFLKYWKEPENCIIQTVSLGGDADTVGAIVGALVGALHGTQWLPTRWFDPIENGEYGRDQLIELAKQLANLNLTSNDDVLIE